MERCVTKSAAIKAGLEPCQSGWFAVGLRLVGMAVAIAH